MIAHFSGMSTVHQRDSVLHNIEHIIYNNVIYAVIILVTLLMCYGGANLYWNKIEDTLHSNDIHFEWFEFLLSEPCDGVLSHFRESEV